VFVFFLLICFLPQQNTKGDEGEHPANHGTVQIDEWHCVESEEALKERRKVADLASLSPSMVKSTVSTSTSSSSSSATPAGASHC
jgi:hypothetical protein